MPGNATPIDDAPHATRDHWTTNTTDVQVKNHWECAVFTFVLLEVLAKGADHAYGELLEKIQDRYAAMNRDSPNPVVHGAADALAFSAQRRTLAPATDRGR
jgi:hypothetical protein